jgi:hypothetical protein
MGILPPFLNAGLVKVTAAADLCAVAMVFPSRAGAPDASARAAHAMRLLDRIMHRLYQRREIRLISLS